MIRRPEQAFPTIRTDAKPFAGSARFDSREGEEHRRDGPNAYVDHNRSQGWLSWEWGLDGGRRGFGREGPGG